jgi:hypothetical protein
MKKILILFFFAIFCVNFLQAQHLFSVSYNELSKETVAQIKNQIPNSGINSLLLTKNNENKDVYNVAFYGENPKIIILNEQTGKHVVITPAENSLSEFLLAPFFIEELKQSVLGNANSFLIIESADDFLVKNVSAVTPTKEDLFIPQFFTGKKENVREVMPAERQILYIFKQKPNYIPAFPNDPENLRYVAQLEEERSYYVYTYRLPMGTLFTYDEHLNPDNSKSKSKVGEHLPFDLTSINMTETQIEATEYALSLWSEKLAGMVPVDIEVKFTPMGPGIIGASYRMQNFLNTGQVSHMPTNTYYVSPLWNQFMGYDATTQRDIKLEMSSNFNFYYGVTGNPGYSQIDWITTMLHEVSHGVGFYPLVGSDGAYTIPPQYPGIFDRQYFQGITGNVCITDLTQAERAALVTSGGSNGEGNLYAGAPGSFLLAANEGTRGRNYTPNPYASGSSGSHWASSVPFPTFMRYYINQGPSGKLHTIGERKIGILKDIGWTEPIIYPNAVWVSFDANGGIGQMTKQQYLPGEAQKLKPNSFSKTGYDYSKWSTQPDGTGTSYNDKETITLTEDIDLFALWSPKSYTLTFNPNGGTVDPPTKTVYYDAPIGEMPIPEREDYIFVEWYYGATIITEETIWNYLGNITVQARWRTPATFTITASATEGGSISPVGTNSVTEGSSILFTITPDNNYEISDLLIDNVSIGIVDEYEFTNITASHTIHAEFIFYEGISENQKNEMIQIVPNPASNTIEIRVMSNGLQVKNIEIYDIYGKKQKAESSNQKAEGVVEMNISHLPAGTYMVKILTTNAIIAKKFIKH